MPSRTNTYSTTNTLASNSRMRSSAKSHASSSPMMCVSARTSSPTYLVRMLEDLNASIRSQPTFRYFSSSLLILYDGAVCPEGLGLEGANCDFNFDSIVLRAKEAEKKGVDYSSFKTETSDSSEAGNTTAQHRDVGPPPPTANGHVTPPLMTDEELSEAHRHVDVRMIDFAHATPGARTRSLTRGWTRGTCLDSSPS